MRKLDLIGIHINFIYQIQSNITLSQGIVNKQQLWFFIQISFYLHAYLKENEKDEVIVY